MSTAPKALASLYEGGREREQVIYTPAVIRDVIHWLWPEGLALDPCSGPESILEPARACGPHVPDPATQDGLGVPWTTRTYVNPPYKHLKAWLAKTVAEAKSGVSEILVLAPVRTHRPWFRVAWLHSDCVIALNSLKFRGYDQAFPAPLCLMYWGSRASRLELLTSQLGERVHWGVGRTEIA
jgi:hypothetical protein